MTVTVLICTHKRKALLKECLQNLFEQSEEKPDQVVIVDGQKGQIGDVVEYWRARGFNIVLCPVTNINLASSRNNGLSLCLGDIIALTDDDVRITRDWIKRIKVLHLEHPEAGAIGGRIIADGDKFIDKIADAVIFPDLGAAGYVRTIAGANITYKKKVVKSVGLFDETLFRGEDVDYNWRVLNKGYKIYYDPELIVYHKHRSTLKKLINQVYMYGRAYYLVRKKWPDMYCVYPHAIKHLKDVLKLGYFFFGIFSEPFKGLARQVSLAARFKMAPSLIICHSAWKAGMAFEILKRFFNRP